MVRHTSIDVYNRIKNEGLLSKLRFKVYDFLYQNDAMTCRELMDAMIKSKNASPEIMAGGTISSRFSELERLGVICEVRERKCKVTGNLAIEWTTTNNLPMKKIKPTIIKCKHCKGVGHFEQQRFF